MAQLQKFCPHCSAVKTHDRGAPAHAVHIVLAVLTAGLWLIVYLIALLIPRGTQCLGCQSAAANASAQANASGGKTHVIR